MHERKREGATERATAAKERRKGERERERGREERGILGGVRREHIIPGGSVSFQPFNVFN